MTQIFLVHLLQKISWFEIGLVGFVLFWQLLRRFKKAPLSSVHQALWLLFMVQLLGLAVYAVLLWRYIEGGPYAKALLPPHSPFLIKQVWAGLENYVAGWVAAGILGWGFWYFFLHRGKGAMFDANDLALAIIGAAAVGWPAVLIFLAATFFLAVLGMLALVLFKKKNLSDRLIVTPFIIPSAIITLFFGSYPLAWTHLDKIRF